MPFDQRAYLETEFRRYYPTAHVVATYPEEEVIQVSCSFDTGTPLVYRMEIGSDDDCYRFLNPGYADITVPFDGREGV
jgi:hypothetical protein